MEANRPTIRWNATYLVLPLLLLSSCGYHLAHARLDAGRGLTISVPTFINRTTTYKIEQQFSQAVRDELIRQSRFSVQAQGTGDVVLNGEVTSISLSPVIFNSAGRGSSYAITIDLKINVMDTRTKKAIFNSDHWIFRDVFELSQTSADLVPEDPAAIDRLSKKFAASLVASILHART